MANSMIFSVKEALRNPGEVYDLRLSLNMEPFEYMGSIRFTRPVQVEGTYSCYGQGIKAEGSISAVLELECDRCAQSFEMALEIPFCEQFVSSKTEDDDYYPIGAAQTIDILPPVQDNIISSIPIERVCREDCKGICPQCGANKNFSTCLCQPAEKENPFAVLRKLVD